MLGAGGGQHQKARSTFARFCLVHDRRAFEMLCAGDGKRFGRAMAKPHWWRGLMRRDYLPFVVASCTSMASAELFGNGSGGD